MGVEAGLASSLEKEPALEQPWAAVQAPPTRTSRCWVESLAGGESPGKMGGAAVWGLPGVGARGGWEEDPASAEPAGSSHPVGEYRPRRPRASVNCPALQLNGFILQETTILGVDTIISFCRLER